MKGSVGAGGGRESNYMGDVLEVVLRGTDYVGGEMGWRRGSLMEEKWKGEDLVCFMRCGKEESIGRERNREGG